MPGALLAALCSGLPSVADARLPSAAAQFLPAVAELLSSFPAPLPSDVISAELPTGGLRAKLAPGVADAKLAPGVADAKLAPGVADAKLAPGGAQLPAGFAQLFPCVPDEQCTGVFTQLLAAVVPSGSKPEWREPAACTTKNGHGCRSVVCQVLCQVKVKKCDLMFQLFVTKSYKSRLRRLRFT